MLAALILPAGLLGDRYGRKKLLLGALVLFGGASLWCAYSSSTGELIAARALLGVGAAAIFPLALSVIPVLFALEERSSGDRGDRRGFRAQLLDRPDPGRVHAGATCGGALSS